MKKEESRKRIIVLWSQRALSEKSADHVLAFYQELRDNHPHLLDFRSKADKYQVIQAWLQPFLVKVHPDAKSHSSK